MDDLPASDRIDVIINLAGARILGWRWSEARKAELRRSRVALTERLVDWIAKAEHKPRLMISASAIGYYGVQPQASAEALNESSPPQDIFMSRLCQEWEAAAVRAREYGVQVACTRFGLVMGKGGALPPMLMPIRLGVGGRMGTGRQRMSWIHLHDLLRAMAHLWSLTPTQADGAWNFTAPESPTQEEFARTAAHLAHRPCFMPTPALPVRLLLGQQADLLLEGQNVAPVRLQATGFSFRYPTMESALRDLM
jgi:uncharacterized protein (TIGR01777 family)